MKYEKPEMELLLILTEDIIVTSGGGTENGLDTDGMGEGINC